MLNDELHFLLLRAFHHSNNTITQKIYALNLLPGQPKILEYLLEHDGAMAKDISCFHVLDKSTVASLIARMEKENLIIRRNHSADKRAYSIHLTEKGRYMAHKVKEICAGVDSKAFKNIPPQDKQHFLEILNTVIRNLEED